MKYTAAGFAAVLLLLAQPILASTAPGRAAAPTGSYVIASSAEFTGKVVGHLETGIAECQSIETVYRFDCYRQNYRAVGRSLNGKPDYRNAQKALKRVENTLKAVVKENGDKTAPPLKSNGRTYKAVRPDTLAASAAAFDRSRAEAATILLRADGRDKVHYQRIAEVVGSNKVILRTELQHLLLRRL